MFGHRSDGTYYYVRYNTKDRKVALWRMDGPKRTVIAHGEWHQLELTISDRKVRGSVNGRLHVEHELERPASRRLGLWTKPDATSAFRNLRVSPEVAQRQR